MSNRWTIEYALRLVSSGLSLIPVSPQTKRPIEQLLPQDPNSGIGSWSPYQLRLPTEVELRAWLAKGAQLAVVCGKISGGLRCLDLDLPRFHQAWAQAVGSLAAGLVLQKTGGGGYQVFFRCPDPGTNEKLAWAPNAAEDSGREIAIETRGEGGYAVIAPSLHPSGNRYVLLEGDWTAIPTLSQAHADALSDAARRLDEAPYTKQQLVAMTAAMQAKSQHAASLNGQGSVIEVYNQNVSVEEALQRYGYTPRLGNRWARPGGVNPSVLVQNGKSFHHNTNDPLADGHWHDAFDLFCYYEHANDPKAAARAAATIFCLPPILRSAPAGQANAAGVAPMPLPSAPSPSALALLANANLTDAGNAECLAALYGEMLRYCHSRKLWLVWDGQRWRENNDGIAWRFALSVAQARYQAAPQAMQSKQLAAYALRCENVRQLSSMLASASVHMQFTTTIDQYDQDPMLASTPSGTLDLRTGQVRQPNPQDNLSLQLGTAYDATADCPRWKQFMQEVFAGDADLIAYVQRALGYSLTADTREQKIFLCYGGGANGKSVFLSIVEQLLGDYAGNASFSTFDIERRSQIGEDLAALRGKRLITIIETSEDRRLDEARVKQLTGGDTITCRFLYGRQFSYKPTFKIFLAMNHLPVIRGTDRGIWRRVALIPFTQSFEQNPDKQLERKLMLELPGVLNWALDGLRAWHAQGLGSCTAVEHATELYRTESDRLGEWLREATIEDPMGILPSSEAYQEFYVWSKNRGERFPLTQTSWGRSMADRGYQTARQRISGKVTTVYLGIRLRVDTDPDASSVMPPAAAAPAQPTPQPVPAAPPTDYDHDKQREVEVKALVRAGKYDKARQHASGIRARKRELALIDWIDRIEGGLITVEDPV